MVIDCDPPYDTLTIPDITVISPNYPLTYGYGHYCQTTLTSDSSVRLKFEDFNLDDDDSCKIDWLEVRDGNSSDSEMIGSKLCGNDIPDEVTSTGKSLTLIFQSNDYFNSLDTGFQITASSGKN